jgi:hypothetical protein
MKLHEKRKTWFEQPLPLTEEKKMDSNQTLAVPLFCAPIGSHPFFAIYFG